MGDHAKSRIALALDVPDLKTAQVLIEQTRASVGVFKVGLELFTADGYYYAGRTHDSLERIGGTLVQAEDELASVNQLIGASFGGTPALTATSGPGFALMTESIGLAVASETPIVVVNVMRGGPSTGIPTTACMEMRRTLW